MFLFIWSDSSDVYYAKLETRNAKREQGPTKTTSGPYFSSGTVKRTKGEREGKSPHARKARCGGVRVSPFSRGVFLLARVSLALLLPRKNGDYSMSRTNASGVVGLAFKSLLYQALSLHSCYFVTTFLPLLVLFWVTYSVSSRNYFGVLNSAQLVCVAGVERAMGRKWKREGGWGHVSYAQWTKNWKISFPSSQSFVFISISADLYSLIFCVSLNKNWLDLTWIKRRRPKDRFNGLADHCQIQSSRIRGWGPSHPDP